MDDDVRRLADECWAVLMRAQPIQATLLGEHQHDDELPDISEEGEARLAGTLADISRRAAAMSRAGHTPQDQVTLDVLAYSTQKARVELASGALEYTVAPAIGGAHVPLFEYLPSLGLTEAAHAEGLLARLRRIPAYLEQAEARLRNGVSRGRTPVARGVRQSVAQLDTYLASDLDADLLLRPAPPAGWSGAGAWREALRAAVADEVRPALARYRDALARDVLPHARPPERAGLCWIDGGEELYAQAVEAYTTMPGVRPASLHETGREAHGELEEEYRRLGPGVLGVDEPGEVLRRLRTDERLRFRTGAEVLAHAQGALARAQAAVSRAFRRLPAAPCVVEPMSEQAALDGTVAYYLEPAPDGSRPGTYFVNTLSPQTKLRHEADVLAFHEAVPGHHTQIALAQELEDLPVLRRHVMASAYVEGWALYTERLADEMGLYPDDEARLGMLSFDSWRSARLVVDTGIHQLGWSRQQAVDHCLEHTPLAPDNIANEVDRYICWPGQALAYKVGQREILRLRREAERRLGADFDLAGFHDTLLSHGALPLPTLERVVSGWLDGTG